MEVAAPLSIMDSELAKYEENLTGADIRRVINQTFGINLDAIASLAQERISVFSKNQWIIQNDTDLFAVHDEFKGQTIGVIIEAIHNSYSHL